MKNIELKIKGLTVGEIKNGYLVVNTSTSNEEIDVFMVGYELYDYMLFKATFEVSDLNGGTDYYDFDSRDLKGQTNGVYQIDKNI